MSKVFTLLSFLFFLLIGSATQAQSIWPGDVNNNGVVNCMDVLYWGIAYNKSGVARNPQSTAWQAQTMPAAWSWAFPNGGMNYAYADANGDGTVNKNDAIQAIDGNFFKTHGTPTTDQFSQISAAARASLKITPNTTASSSGETISVQLAIEEAFTSSTNRNGFAFILSYNPSLVIANSFSFEQDNGLDPTGNNAFLLVKNNATKGEIEIALTQIGNGDLMRRGSGNIGRFTFQIADNFGNGNLQFQVKNISYIDQGLNFYPVNVQNSAQITVVSNSTPCPDVIDPVCGSDGKVYLNACFAEAAGVTDYTPGVCNPDCVDPTRINPNTVCPQIYEPVCGCNGVTYANECEAGAAGVREWTTGPCSNNNSDCYDPALIVNSSSTDINARTGVITINCPENLDPVCGCNGVTYDNACLAEANGVKFYTKGTCGLTCVNPAQMNPNAVCTLEYNPVCGCNGVTYGNACVAQAAGVVSYTQGVCGTVSPWCSKAVPLSCGDFLSGETTANAGNNINQYPCSNKAYLGPERVYIINKTSAGDLQIGLEILTQGLDLDLFLLAPTCSQLTCIRSSTTNNTQTNNEGILLEDAPIGTYYLVVDGAAAGQYRVELSCGYLECNDAIQLACGQPYNGNNANGEDNVSLYGCSNNVLNVENNGPEMVHYFTITQAGQVTIQLTNLSANLELFLLNDCNRGACVDFSQNSGTSNETISAFLQPGTYYVVVDGYNGATSNYRLTVNCTSACNIDLNLNASAANCGQTNGSVSVSISNGSPGYYVSFTGPISGSYTTNNSNTTVNGLPAGTYKFTVIDCKNCKITKEVTIGSGGNLTVQTVVTNASCGENGKVKVTVNNGTSPYKIYLSGTADGVFQAINSTFTLSELIPGNYELYIVDANGCSITKYATVGQGANNFYFTATPNPAACEAPGSITVKTFNGSGTYKIKVTGPKNGTATSNSSTFNIVNLPPGTYTVTVEEAGGCSHTKTVTVTTTELAISVSSSESDCTSSSTVVVNILTGKPGFMIIWNGPVSDTINTNSTSYTLPNNLPPGTYTITVKDANWCVVSKNIQINPSGLGLELTPENGMCEANGIIHGDIIGGTKPYQVYIVGPTNEQYYVNTNWFKIENLDAGNYVVTVVDANGCEVSKTTQVVIQESNLSFTASLTAGSCGSNNSILVNIFGGKPSYVVMWTGPVNGQASTPGTFYEIPDLPPGTYNIQVKDANWCMTFKSFTIHPSTTNLFTTVVTNGACESPGSIKVTFTGGMPSYKVTWTGPESGSVTTSASMYTIDDLPAGTYMITVKDSKGCTDTKTVQVVVTEGGLTLNASLIVNECGQYNTIWIDITGGTPTYMVTWEGPVSGSMSTNNQGFEIQDVPPGKYTITVKDANWCIVSTMIMVFETPSNLFEATPTNRICESPGSIKLNFTGGSPAYQIVWTGPTPGSASTSGNMFLIENLEEGTYTIKVTDANGCTSTKTVTVGYEEGGISIETALIVNDCGQYNTIWIDIVGGMAPYVIIWEGPENGSDTVQIDAYEIKDLPPGKYTITVKDKNWCYTSTMVMVFDTPINIFSATPNNPACNQEGSIALTLTGMPNYTVAWSGQETGMTTVSGNSYTIPNLSAGNYTITVTDAKGCVEIENVTLTGSGAGNLVATITGVNGNQSELGKINVNITAGTAPFTIALSGAATTSVNANNLGLVEISNLPAGQYNVTVTASNGCTVSQQVTITITENIVSISTSQTGNTCSTTGAILVNITGGTPNYSVSWSGAGITGSAMTSGNSISIQDLLPGTYTVTVSSANGTSDSEALQVFASPSALSISASVTNGICGQNGQLQLSITGGVGPFTVEWSGPSSSSVTVNGSSYTIPNLPSGTYTVKVSENSGCSQSKTMSVTNSNQQPVANFSYSVNGATVTFINQSSPGTYSWAFGDNSNPNNNSNPSHIYGNNASYQACLTVTNSCGSQSICKTVTVGIPANAALIDVKDLSGATGAIIFVPVTIENCVTGSLVSFAGSLSISNPAVAIISGIIPGSMSPQYNANNGTFSYFNNSGSGLPCGPGQILFYVAVQILGNQGTSAVLNITGTPLTIELGGMNNGTPSTVPYSISSGIVSVANTAKIAGEVTTYWGAGLPSVEVTATHGATSLMKVTDENGHYELPALPVSEMYRIEPKRTAQAENGLSTYALFAGQRFILGMEPLEIVSPYQIIAGDANCDGQFSSLDLFLIQRLIIGTSQDFGQCPSWVFVKAGSPMPIEFTATNVFPYYSCDTLMLMKDTISDFIGVKVGDILGHANPIAVVGNQTSPRNNDILQLLAISKFLNTNGIVEIPVTSSNFEQIASYQMGLSFDINKLAFIDIVPSSNPALAKLAVGATEVENGTLRLSWFDLRGEGVSVNSDEVLFTLRFRVLYSIENLADVLEVNSRFIRAEAYTNEATPMDVVLTTQGSAILAPGDEPTISYKLYQNVPNPFAQQTYIGFDLPSDTQADLIIFDQLGKMVRKYSGNFTRGYNRIEVPKQSLADGVYYYTLRTADFADTKSMIVLD